MMDQPVGGQWGPRFVEIDTLALDTRARVT